jgi:hypothetical protein
MCLVKWGQYQLCQSARNSLVPYPLLHSHRTSWRQRQWAASLPPPRPTYGADVDELHQARRRAGCFLVFSEYLWLLFCVQTKKILSYRVWVFTLFLVSTLLIYFFNISFWVEWDSVWVLDTCCLYSTVKCDSRRFRTCYISSNLQWNLVYYWSYFNRVLDIYVS